MSKWNWMLRQFFSKLWVRATMFCLLGIITALVAFLLKDIIPDDISQKVGADAVDNILQIIASSMLAVTTFSLSIMVAAYSAATSNVTPRATQLMLRDSTAQNALSVFLGAFLYSLVGIIALSIGIYGNNGRLVLFVMTIAVIILIVCVMLKWIHYLSRLGRVSETINLIEKATAHAIKERMHAPYLGGVALGDYNPHSLKHHPVKCKTIGYVQHIDMLALSRVCERSGGELFLRKNPGAFNDGVQPLFYSSVALDQELSDAACRAFTIGDCRSFDQDLRFGVVVLGEVASRALSPAVNDPGTAIDIIGTSVRILMPWVSNTTAVPEPTYNKLHVPALKIADIFDDIFPPIIRDGKGNLQVAIKIQKAMKAFVAVGDGEAKDEAKRISAYALAYANETLLLDADKEKVAMLAAEVSNETD